MMARALPRKCVVCKYPRPTHNMWMAVNSRIATSQRSQGPGSNANTLGNTPAYTKQRRTKQKCHCSTTNHPLSDKPTNTKAASTSNANTDPNTQQHPRNTTRTNTNTHTHTQTPTSTRTHAHTNTHKHTDKTDDDEEGQRRRKRRGEPDTLQRNNTLTYQCRW